MDIVSFHSRVVCGYVGNSVAVPTIQYLGLNAWPIDTVVLGHHPGHGPTTRKMTAAGDIATWANGAFKRIPKPCAVLLGYLGSADQGHAISEFLINTRDAGDIIPIYLDPVFGDTAEGIYVDQDIVDYYKDVAVPMANVVMPNCFELAHLTGIQIDSISAAVSAAHILIERGPDIVMLSSVPGKDHMLTNVVVTAEKAWAISTMHLALEAKGTGDLLSAAFTALHAGGKSVPEAFHLASRIVQSSVIDASSRGLMELDIPHMLAQNLLKIEKLQLIEI